MARNNPPIPATGLTVILNPENADLDIVFVHGFRGHPERTWSCKVDTDEDRGQPPNKVERRSSYPFSASRKAIYWPRDLLPHSFPNARILSYGYDTNIRHIAGKPVCKSTVYDIAGNFLQDLRGHRRLHSQRRLVFIAHSLGGIVVKETLRRSSGFQYARQADIRQICDSTIGIIFFGTPHQGSDLRHLLQKVAEGLARAVGFTANQQIIDTLLPSSERLRELRDEFGPMAQVHRWQIYSFQEALGISALGGRKVVEDPSSYINLPDVETTQHIGRNHMDMCRFTGLSDMEFEKVTAALRRIIDTDIPTQTSQQVLGPDDSEKFVNKKENLINNLRFDRVDFRMFAIKAAHNKTCEWFLTDPTYMDWSDLTQLHQHHGFLWIKGKPGAGKSTMMKFTWIDTQKSRKGTISIFYFFNARGNPLERSVQGMFRSLLAQLIDRVINTKDDLVKIRQMLASSKAQDSWSVEGLQDVFRHVVLGLNDKPAICFIDALDECDEDDIRNMVSFFEDLSDFVVESDIQFEVCLASRHYPHISISRGLTLTLEDRAGHDQDITTYIDAKLKIGDSQLAHQIRAEIQSKAAGVFMWVVLVVKILNKEYESGRIHELRIRLAELPGDLHGLFCKIMAKDKRNTEDLLHCIQWILFSRERLDPRVLYFALLSEKVERGFSGIPPDAITPDLQQRFILDTSKGLAEVVVDKDTELSTVQFIHESVRDFFLKENGFNDLWPDVGKSPVGISHEYLKKACEAWIHVPWWFIPRYASSKSSTMNHVNFSSSMFIAALPFLRHAVFNVLFHANEAQRAGFDQQEYLTNFSRERWIWLANYLRGSKARRYTQNASLLYILAVRDCDTLIAIHPDPSAFLEVEQEHWRNPFPAAIEHGSCLAIQKFIESEAVDNEEVPPSLIKLGALYREHWSSNQYTIYLRDRDFESAAKYLCHGIATGRRFD